MQLYSGVDNAVHQSLHLLHKQYFTCLQLRHSLAVLLTNVKACKLKGVVSQARLLCCSATDECLEPLAPPSGSSPGDRVTFLNFPGNYGYKLNSTPKYFKENAKNLRKFSLKKPNLILYNNVFAKAIFI